MEKHVKKIIFFDISLYKLMFFFSMTVTCRQRCLISANRTPKQSFRADLKAVDNLIESCLVGEYLTSLKLPKHDVMIS